MNNNQLSGTIPSTIGSLVNLQYLYDSYFTYFLISNGIVVTL